MLAQRRNFVALFCAVLCPLIGLGFGVLLESVGGASSGRATGTDFGFGMVVAGLAMTAFGFYWGRTFNRQSPNIALVQMSFVPFMGFLGLRMWTAGEGTGTYLIALAFLMTVSSIWTFARSTRPVDEMKRQSKHEGLPKSAFSS